MNPGQTDTQLSGKLNVLHQEINHACRELVKDGLFTRDRSLGSIWNIPLINTVPDVQSAVSIADAAGLSEEYIKEILDAWLQNQGWITTVAWGKAHGIDILAEKDGHKWIIEVKGCGSRNAMRVNYFLAILGETLQRMDDPKARYGIALPDMRQYRNLWSKLPQLAKERTGIEAIFVAENGDIAFEN